MLALAVVAASAAEPMRIRVGGSLFDDE